MKKTILFVLVLIASGCADPIPRNLDDLSMQGPLYLDLETLEPYSGPAYRMSEYDSTRAVLRVNLRDGKFHGDFEDFEPENAARGLGLYQTGTYRDGQREGRYEYLYPSGVLRGRGTYENDLEEGLYESWFENGEPRSKTTHLAGEVDGPAEGYYENGQLEEKTTYLAGEVDGLLETYHENGQLRGKSTYVDGKPDGQYESYHENGQLWVKGTLNMGEQCGEWIEDGETVIYDPCPLGGT
jgi:antitoxin component YwqK of YwqJK toxin-antitoxin module